MMTMAERSDNDGDDDSYYERTLDSLTQKAFVMILTQRTFDTANTQWGLARSWHMPSPTTSFLLASHIDLISS